MVGIATTLGLIATIAYYSHSQERTLLAQNEATMLKLTDTLAAGLYSVMLAGSADIAQALTARLKTVPEVSDFDIMRVDGTEAFRDNKTILDVNARRGEEQFLTRDAMEPRPIMKSDDPDLRRAIDTLKSVATYNNDAAGNRQLVFLAPLANQSGCYKCHGRNQKVRGVMRLTTSLAAVELDILKVRQDALILFGLALIGTVLVTGYMLGKLVVRPIEEVTRAMARVSGGDLDFRIAESSGDEIGRMGASFNQMTSDLRSTYRRLRREQDKLTTVIETATEGIVVTDATGTVVLVNPAAALLLGKSGQDLLKNDFLDLLDDRGFMEQCIACREPVDILYRQRDLQVQASVIRSERNQVVGSVALVRNVTEEKRLEADLRKAATTDVLTGLYNRRFLDATLSAEFNRALRSRGTLSVIMMDIDHFKKFNDTHGHDQGDRVLQMVSLCLRETVRPFDYACRYGGEEYAAILPDMDARSAAALAERVRAVVERTEVDGLHVRISLGVATYPHFPAAAAVQLIEAADAALYRAKEGGRNQVAVAQAAA